MLRDEDLIIDIGRCVGGSFERIVHVPTGVSRNRGPLLGESGARVRARMLAEIEAELVSRGLTQYILEPRWKRGFHGEPG